MSLQPNFKLSIPKPCHEDWDRMTVSEKGRFCDSCSKLVMDLTGKTDREIIAIVSKSGGGVCGRVNADQLSNDAQLKRSNSFFIQRFLAAVIIAFGSFLFSLSADAKVKMEKFNYELTSLNDSLITKKDSGMVVIKGIVTDASTKEAIPFAIVQIKNGDTIILSTTADINGEFKFRFEKGKLKKVNVLAQYLGYNKYLIQDLELKEGKTHYTDIELKLSMGCNVSQGLIVINYYDDGKPLGQFNNAPSGTTINGSDYRSMPK